MRYSVKDNIDPIVADTEEDEENTQFLVYVAAVDARKTGRLTYEEDEVKNVFKDKDVSYVKTEPTRRTPQTNSPNTVQTQAPIQKRVTIISRYLILK